jgi:prephenate dehydrogenase
MQRRLADCQVTVVGLGLMGGSLAGALRGRCRAVVGVARREPVLQVALAQGLIDRGTTNIAEGVAGADIVVLATPVRVIIRQLAEIAPLLPEGCLLMDMGSTKVQIVAEMARLPGHVQPLGGHPMCGKEVSGIEVADPALYRGRTFILTPLPRTSEAALALGCELAEATGAHTLVLEA